MDPSSEKCRRAGLSVEQQAAIDAIVASSCLVELETLMVALTRLFHRWSNSIRVEELKGTTVAEVEATMAVDIGGLRSSLVKRLGLGAKSKTSDILPPLQRLGEAAGERIAQWPCSPQEKAAAWLQAVADTTESCSEHEAAVYLASRGTVSDTVADVIRDDWKEAAARVVTGFLGEASQEGFSSEASVVRGASTGDLPHFWDMTETQRFTIDATMLRTASWFDIGGFDHWWKRVDSDLQESLTLDGVGVYGPKAAQHLFALCRSDEALRRFPGTLRQFLARVVAGQIQGRPPWYVSHDHYTGMTLQAFPLVAASILFCSRRLGGRGIDQAVLDDAANHLLEEAAADGGWPLRAGQPGADIETTAMAVHGLAIHKPLGWTRPAQKAAEFLLSRQHGIGYWSTKGGPGPAYLTVLTLDAIALAHGEESLTFAIDALPDPEQDDRPGPEADEKNVFRRVGEGWEVRYDGGKKIVLLGTSLGPASIAYLLERPNKKVSAIDLDKAVGDSQHAARERIDLNHEELESADQMPNCQEVADRDALRAAEAALTEARCKLEEAKQSGDVTETESLETQIDQLEHYLKSARGLSGKTRSFADVRERARSRVAARIRRTLKKLEKECPALAKHLDAKIDFGGNLQYCPAADVRWVTS